MQHFRLIHQAVSVLALFALLSAAFLLLHIPLRRQSPPEQSELAVARLEAFFSYSVVDAGAGAARRTPPPRFATVAQNVVLGDSAKHDDMSTVRLRQSWASAVGSTA